MADIRLRGQSATKIALLVGANLAAIGPETGFSYIISESTFAGSDKEKLWARLLFPNIRDYRIICTAIEIALGPLLLRAFDDLFASPAIPLFSLPLRGIPGDNATRVASLVGLLGRDAPAIDPERFYYTSENNPGLDALLLGDMLNYVRYNRDAVATPNGSTVWGAGQRVREVDVAISAINDKGAMTLVKDALDSHYAWKTWGDLAREGVANISKKERLVALLAAPQNIKAVEKQKFHSSDPRVIRDVLLPILVGGRFSHLVAQLGQEHPFVLGAGYWPLPTHTIAVPAKDAKEKIQQRLVGRLGEATLKLYAPDAPPDPPLPPPAAGVAPPAPAGRAWSTADFGAPTDDALRFIQEMCPLTVLPLMADVLSLLYGQDKELQKQIAAGQNIVRNLQAAVEEQTDMRQRIRDLSDTSKPLHQTAQRFWMPTPQHMLRMEITGIIRFRPFVRFLLAKALGWCQKSTKEQGLRDARMEDMTARANPGLRLAFIELAASMEQKQALRFTSQYHKDMEFNTEPNGSIEARRAMARALYAFYGTGTAIQAQRPAPGFIIL